MPMYIIIPVHHRYCLFQFTIIAMPPNTLFLFIQFKYSNNANTKKKSVKHSPAPLEIISNSNVDGNIHD